MNPQEIADKYGFIMGKKGKTDHLIQNISPGYASYPFYIAKDGKVIDRFRRAKDRGLWLEEYDAEKRRAEHASVD